MQPAPYYRQNKTWGNWLGKTGAVIASTLVTVSSPELNHLAPYSFVLVDFGNEKHEFMGSSHDVFEIGDTIECVLRRTNINETSGLIDYTIKVRKLK